MSRPPAPTSSLSEDAGAFLGSGSEMDGPELGPAMLAYRSKDYPRMIGQCLAVMGLESTITTLPNGHCWSFKHHSAAMYVSFDRERSELAIEAPLVRLPTERLVPLMRHLLELNRWLQSSARFCLRGSLVLLRFVDRLENLSPPKVVHEVGWMALTANRFDDALAVTYHAPMVGPEAIRGRLDYKFLGQPRGVRAAAAAIARALAKPEGASASGAPPASLGAPKPLASSRLASTDASRGQQVQTTHALCSVLEHQCSAAQELFYRETHGASTVALVRASLYRLLGEFAGPLPIPVSYILERGAALLPSLPPPPKTSSWGAKTTTAGTGDAASLVPLLHQVADAGGRVPAPGSFPRLEPFRTALEIKAHLRLVLQHVDEGPDSLAFRYHLLLGALHELELRASLPPNVKEHAANTRQRAGATAASTSAVAAMRELIERIVA